MTIYHMPAFICLVVCILFELCHFTIGKHLINNMNEMNKEIAEMHDKAVNDYEHWDHIAFMDLMKKYLVRFILAVLETVTYYVMLVVVAISLGLPGWVLLGIMIVMPKLTQMCYKEFPNRFTLIQYVDSGISLALFITYILHFCM